jgi:hypothetical protein
MMIGGRVPWRETIDLIAVSLGKGGHFQKQPSKYFRR